MQEAQQAASASLAMRKRREGASVELALSPEKPKTFFARAGKGGYSHAALIGPDDVAGGKVRIKDLATREEMEEPL